MKKVLVSTMVLIGWACGAADGLDKTLSRYDCCGIWGVVEVFRGALSDLMEGDDTTPKKQEVKASAKKTQEKATEKDATTALVVTPPITSKAVVPTKMRRIQFGMLPHYLGFFLNPDKLPFFQRQGGIPRCLIGELGKKEEETVEKKVIENKAPHELSVLPAVEIFALLMADERKREILARCLSKIGTSKPVESAVNFVVSTQFLVTLAEIVPMSKESEKGACSHVQASTWKMWTTSDRPTKKILFLDYEKKRAFIERDGWPLILSSYDEITLSCFSDQMKNLAEALKKNTTLTALRFFLSDVGDEGARTLATALYVNTTLTTLDLKSSGIGNEGAKAIAAALRENTTIAELNLQHNDEIGDEGVIALAEAFQVNTTLKNLNIGGRSKIGGEGIKALTAALHINKTLKHLTFTVDYMGSNRAKMLAEALRENTSLTILELYLSKIGDEGAQELVEVLCNHPSLRTLDLSLNHISPETKDILSARVAGRADLKLIL